MSRSQFPELPGVLLKTDMWPSYLALILSARSRRHLRRLHNEVLRPNERLMPEDLKLLEQDALRFGWHKTGLPDHVIEHLFRSSAALRPERMLGGGYHASMKRYYLQKLGDPEHGREPLTFMGSTELVPQQEECVRLGCEQCPMREGEAPEILYPWFTRIENTPFRLRLILSNPPSSVRSRVTCIRLETMLRRLCPKLVTGLLGSEITELQHGDGHGRVFLYGQIVVVYVVLRDDEKVAPQVTDLQPKRNRDQFFCSRDTDMSRYVAILQSRNLPVEEIVPMTSSHSWYEM